VEDAVDVEAEAGGAPTADSNGNSGNSSGDSSGDSSGGSSGDTQASAAKPAAVLGVAASQTTEPSRDQELLAGTGTWVCPKCAYGNHAALRYGSRVVLR